MDLLVWRGDRGRSVPADRDFGTGAVSLAQGIERSQGRSDAPDDSKGGVADDLERETARLKRLVADLVLDKAILQEASTLVFLSVAPALEPVALGAPSRRHEAIEEVRRALPVSERRTCRVLGQHRSTQRRC
nr:hypothetical protein [Sphingomonas oleivorans]